MAKVLNLQDSFLNHIRKENVPTTLYLVNGFQLKGQVRGFDNFTVVMESEGKHMLVYKHAISTVTPSRVIGNIVEIARKEAETEGEA
ncbi:MAG: RNA chaperone Hfq [Bacillota bacterium]|jgi:host factor-I protein